MELIFLVQGSAPEPYEVIVHNSPFSLSCSCQAGLNRLPCKHRRAIMNGEDPGIIKGDVGELTRICKIAKETGYYSKYINYEELRENKRKQYKKIDSLVKNYIDKRISFALSEIKTETPVDKAKIAVEELINELIETEKEIRTISIQLFR